MAIDFDVEPEFQEQIDWVENFTKEEIEPLYNFLRAPRLNGKSIDEDAWQAIKVHSCESTQAAH